MQIHIIREKVKMVAAEEGVGWFDRSLLLLLAAAAVLWAWYKERQSRQVKMKGGNDRLCSPVRSHR